MVQYGKGNDDIYRPWFDVLSHATDRLDPVGDTVQLCTPPRRIQQPRGNIQRVYTIRAKQSDLRGYFTGAAAKVQYVFAFHGNIFVDPFLRIEAPVSVLPIAESDVLGSARYFFVQLDFGCVKSHSCFLFYLHYGATRSMPRVRRTNLAIATYLQ